ncbi:MAG: hypothetical protein JW966_14635, partial [Anaerolineae bacterium]|nr:hypothetical protein [Anaerolineae bacterium]
REAELLAALETGANPIRLTASGDSLLEQAEPRLYVDDEDEGDKNDDAADQDDAAGATSGEDDTQDGAQAELPGELQIQFELEARYLARFEESGADIFLSDSQYSPYLLVRAQDEDENLSWEQFTELHEERIRYYASTLKPAIYAVVSEPAAYATYSAIDLPGGDDDPDRNLDAWVSHLKRLITIVEEESPDTRIAVSITLDDDLNADFYERVLGLDGLDIITLEVYQPSSFERVQDLLDERGHPLDFGQELWISETWYGFCMAPQRSMELDAMWLDVVVAFAASEGFRGVLPNHYGCFLQAGGTMIEPNVDLDGRTEVWEKWRDLVAQWQMPLEETESTPADGD